MAGDLVSFPVLLDAPGRAAHPLCPRAVPWDLIAPHARRARRTYGRSLKRLAAAGGLDPVELIALLDGRRPPALREARADPAGLLAYCVADLIKRAAVWTNARPDSAPGAVLAPGFVWQCGLCGTGGSTPGAVPPAKVQCPFCRTVHVVVQPVAHPVAHPTEEDAPTPPGAADSPHEPTPAPPAGFVFRAGPGPGSGAPAPGSPPEAA